MRHALPGKALGFTMLEALIAVLILAVGVLSVANLLIKSYRFTQQGAYDTLALQLASNMADRMRANAGMLGASSPYVFDTQTASAVVASTNFYFTQTSAGCSSGSAVCATEAVKFDLSEWLTAVRTSLPGGRALICHDSPAYTITGGFSWPCSNQPTDPLVIKIGWVSRFSALDQGNATSDVVIGDTANGTTATPQAMIVVDAGGS